MLSSAAESVKKKYFGGTAAGYDKKRDDTDKRRKEMAAIREFLADEGAGTSVLDIPFGTGWLAPFHAQKGFEVIGLDVSSDMLDVARDKIDHLPVQDGTFYTRVGDVFDTKLEDKSVDVALCIRLLNWISADDLVLAFKELQRVTKRRIIFNIRVWEPGTKYKRAHRIENLHRALGGWKIVRDVPLHENTFRMVEIAPGS